MKTANTRNIEYVLILFSFLELRAGPMAPPFPVFSIIFLSTFPRSREIASSEDIEIDPARNGFTDAQVKLETPDILRHL